MKNKRHLLLEKAKTYPRFTGDLSPSGCRYDAQIGAWVVEGTSTLFVDTSDHEKPRTKKADLETGEDQKSE